jgi:hypothetical protein
MGGTNANTNLVSLLPGEHFVVHQLLVKIYPENKKLVYAANLMSANGANHKRTNKQYSWLKKRMSEARAGTTYTKTPEAIEKTRQAHIGAKRSEESKARMSAAVRVVGPRGPMSDEQKANISAARKGKAAVAKHSPETLLKMRAAQQRRRALEAPLR